FHSTDDFSVVFPDGGCAPGYALAFFRHYQLRPPLDCRHPFLNTMAKPQNAWLLKKKTITRHKSMNTL
ncbi:hypothetical protein ACVGX7_26025, partial [Enterobacter hormaechei]